MKKLWIRVILMVIGLIAVVMLQQNLKNNDSSKNQNLLINSDNQTIPAKVVIEQK
jgi:hypothetical protein